MAASSEALTLVVRNLEGATVVSWTGSPSCAAAEVKKAVSEATGKHVIRVALLWKDRELVDGDVLADVQLPDGAELQLILNNAVAEKKWKELQETLGALGYGSSGGEVFPLACECLEIGLQPVGEVAGAVRDACEEAGSITEMPDDWFELLANHPDSRCDTPAQFHSDLIHAAIFHGISLADKPFFRNGPWTDKVDYPEWGWGARIGGTPLDLAARKLETSLENPPCWGLTSDLPKPDDELERLQANFMTLLSKGFKMSRVEGGGRIICDGHYDAETVWKPALLERSEPPYGRYGAIHSAWKEAGMPLVTIPAEKPAGANDDP